MRRHAGAPRGRLRAGTAAVCSALLSGALAACAGDRGAAPSGVTAGNPGSAVAGLGGDLPLDGALRDGAAEPTDGATAPDAACPALPDAAAADPGAIDPVDREAAVEPHAYFRIRVIDRASGQPLAGARLETTNFIVLHTDVNGVVAFYEPGLMATEVYFHASHPGYEIAEDAFGFRGKALQVSEGGTGEIAMDQVASAAPPAVASDLDSRLLAGPAPGPDVCFGIRAIDADTGRGVPLVRLTDGSDEYFSDSLGWVAFCHPDRLAQPVRFEVSSHGYRLSGGGDAATLDAAAGARVELALDRIHPAERLYRVTGQGIYRDSVLLGRAVPTTSPVPSGLVAGQDTVQTTVYRDRVFWIWGDTSRFAYPLGNYRAAGARSELPPPGMSPHLGVDLSYFVDASGFAKPMAPVATVPGDGSVTWLASLIVLPDAAGAQRLFASYFMLRSLTEPVEAGVLRFDDDRELFVKALALPSVDALGPNSHPTRVRHAGGEYAYFQPTLRISASAEAIVDPQTYESFSAYRAGSDEVERAADGSAVYDWKRATAPSPRAAIEAQGLPVDQALDGHMRDSDSAEMIAVHDGSSRAWNPYRGRFVQMTAQDGGTSSYLGEIWYAEADTPMGPWVYARKIVSHDDYTFYNPRQHPFFDRAGGRVIFFEGSYTNTFAGEVTPTPRYEYNQVMYRLDLDDPRLALPVPIYDLAAALPGELVTKADLPEDAPPLRAAFFAPDRAAPGLVPVSWSAAACAGPRRLVVGDGELPALLYALPPDARALPPATIPLFEYSAADGRHAYAIDGALELAGFTRAEQPIVHVWPNPIGVALPVADYLGELRASAGEDRCLTETQAGAGAQVALDAGGSHGGAAAITEYVWHLPAGAPCPLALGATATVHLPAGTHLIRLQVTDGAGHEDSDELVVQIAAR